MYRELVYIQYTVCVYPVTCCHSDLFSSLESTKIHYVFIRFHEI